MGDIYHKGNRDLQDKFDSRRLADRMNDLIIHDEISDKDKAFIESLNMFFISTVDDEGRPTVSYKGGAAGFIRVLDSRTIAFPGYDGNGMFLTAGNLNSNSDVGLLFISFETPNRLRLHGTATIDDNDLLLDEWLEAQYIVRIKVRNLFVNCPRYIHDHGKSSQSKFVPMSGVETPVAQWKSLEVFDDVLPRDDTT
ncbi:MAG: pyridoxamine 5'-phosphate oxidase family protein [Pseudomonadales bacterium]|jgi:predicted pyridoxine 5'-phosphate oxidase superfamily flavin-nucleotide-binding protein